MLPQTLTPQTAQPKWRALASVPTATIFRLFDRAGALGGAVAQLGERLVRNEEVRGSTPLGSTRMSLLCDSSPVHCHTSFWQLVRTHRTARLRRLGYPLLIEGYRCALATHKMCN